MKSIIVLVCSSLLLMAQAPKDQVKMKEHIIKRLRAFIPTEHTKQLRFKQKISNKKKIHYIRVFKKGFFRLGKDQWIYIITVPDTTHNHDEKGLSLAIDQNGTLYENHAHVCAGIVRFGSSTSLPTSSKHFFSTFDAVEDNMTWQEVRQ